MGHMTDTMLARLSSVCILPYTISQMKMWFQAAVRNLKICSFGNYKNLTSLLCMCTFCITMNVKMQFSCFRRYLEFNKRIFFRFFLLQCVEVYIHSPMCTFFVFLRHDNDLGNLFKITNFVFPFFRLLPSE